jgi:membrane protease YdiL (CAAX protease family)
VPLGWPLTMFGKVSLQRNGMCDEQRLDIHRPRDVTWTGVEILVAVFLAWFFWPQMTYEALRALGFERWYYGNDAPEVLTRMGLWSRLFAFPFQVLSFALLFSGFSGTRLSQLGLTVRHFGRNLVSGLAGLLILAPITFGLHWCVRQLSARSGEGGVEKHALEVLAQQHLYPSEWVLLVLTAMLTAPVLEELTFRGALQPWLATRRWGGHAAMLGAFALAIAYRGERIIDAVFEGIGSFALAAMPALFVLALVPVYLLVWWRSRTPLGPAIFGTALLFACIHASVWPTPVPLFVLALGLGLLAYRTRSLVGPIVLHSLFNGISCVQLLLAMNQ